MTVNHPYLYMVGSNPTPPTNKANEDLVVRSRIYYSPIFYSTSELTRRYYKMSLDTLSEEVRDTR